MSFQAIAWALKQDVGSPLGKFILVTLANYADDKGRCYPSQQTIATQCQCSLRVVTKWIKILREKEFLQTQTRRIKNGFKTSDLITILTNKEAQSSQAHGSDEPNDKSHQHEMRRNLSDITYQNTPNTTQAKKPAQKQNQKSKPSLKATRLSEEWTLSPQDHAFAREMGWSDEAIEQQALRFYNYWTSKAGSDALKLNWHRTWQNWVSLDKSQANAHPHKRATNPRHAPSKAQHRQAQNRQSIAQAVALARGMKTQSAPPSMSQNMAPIMSRAVSQSMSPIMAPIMAFSNVQRSAAQ